MHMASENRPRKFALRTLVVCAAALPLALLAPLAAEAKPPSAHMDGSKAVAPKSAPKIVKDMIRAGNKIRHKRYKWGGGHGDWQDKGYDCSGAVSFVLHKAGILDYPLDSKGFMKWGAQAEGEVGLDLRLQGARLHDRRRPPLRHLLHHRRRQVGPRLVGVHAALEGLSHPAPERPLRPAAPADPPNVPRPDQPVSASDHAFSTGRCSAGLPGGESVEEQFAALSLSGKINGFLASSGSVFSKISWTPATGVIAFT